MTTNEMLKIRDAVRTLAQLPDEEWEKLCTHKVEKNNQINDVTKLILKIGIPAHLNGYSYIRSAIIYFMNAKNDISITKEIYPEVAKQYNTTSSRVERGIRHAIEVAFERGNIKLIEEIFGTTVKITNGVVIATIAEYIKMH